MENIERINNACINDGLAGPKYYIQSGSVTIEFEAHLVAVEGGDEGGIGEGGIGNGVDNGIGNDFGVNVSDIQKEIINLMNTNPQVTFKKISETLKLTKRKTEYSIKDLQEKGIVERIGADKNSYWVVKV